ncbi:MAG: isocitrate/isopropylmalate family dehydrogenase, partial [bacterium]
MTAGRSHRVTLIPGDGVGPEVIAAAIRIVEASGVVVQWDRQLAGQAAVEEYGLPISDQLMKSIRRNRVALKGPLATQVGTGFRSVNVALRKAFDLYANLRPVKNVPGIDSPFSGVDLVVVREN